MIAIRGFNSAIVRALFDLLHNEVLVRVGRDERVPLDVDRYLFCAGLLFSTPEAEQSAAEIASSMEVNFFRVMEDCELILARNPRARICCIGSESGFSGSFDGTYARAKRYLHEYVETKRLPYPEQQLVCVAPGIIEDAGMTLRRTDTEVVQRRRQGHRKRRFLSSAEVAGLVHHVLYVDRGYLSGTVLRMNGGDHIR